jgi:hypothetical protein
LDISTTIDSNVLGLPKRSLEALDSVLGTLPKEQVAQGCVAILNALAANRTEGFRSVNMLYADSLPSEEKQALHKALEKPDAAFLEPPRKVPDNCVNLTRPYFDVKVA